MPGFPLASITAAAATEIRLSADGRPTSRIQLLPIGQVDMRDGRGPFFVHDPAAVIRASRAHAGKVDIMVDYDHQNHFGVKPGVAATAIAAGWIKPESLTADATGIWADVEWTPAAAAKLKAREYRYISPVFSYNPFTKEILQLDAAALTNVPAIPDLQAAASLRGSRSDNPEETEMDLKTIAAALGLAGAASEADVLAKARALAEKETALAAAASRHGLATDADLAQVIAAAAQVNPAEYVPAAAMTELRAEVASLQQAAAAREVAGLVAAALDQGKISPAMEEWARDYATRDRAGFQKYVETAPAIIAAGEQFQRLSTAPAAAGALTVDEKEMAAKLGVSEDAYLAARGTPAGGK